MQFICFLPSYESSGKDWDTVEEYSAFLKFSISDVVTVKLFILSTAISFPV